LHRHRRCLHRHGLRGRADVKPGVDGDVAAALDQDVFLHELAESLHLDRDAVVSGDDEIEEVLAIIVGLRRGRDVGALVGQRYGGPDEYGL